MCPQDDAATRMPPYARPVSNHRALLPDGFFHVFTRGIPERPIYLDDDDRHRFVALLDQACAVAPLTDPCAVPDATHYHAVVAGHTRRPLTGDAVAAQLLRGATSIERHGRFGHLFAERFSARGDRE